MPNGFVGVQAGFRKYVRNGVISVVNADRVSPFGLALASRIWRSSVMLTGSNCFPVVVVAALCPTGARAAGGRWSRMSRYWLASGVATVYGAPTTPSTTAATR